MSLGCVTLLNHSGGSFGHVGQCFLESLSTIQRNLRVWAVLGGASMPCLRPFLLHATSSRSVAGVWITLVAYLRHVDASVQLFGESFKRAAEMCRVCHGISPAKELHSLSLISFTSEVMSGKVRMVSECPSHAHGHPMAPSNHQNEALHQNEPTRTIPTPCLSAALSGGVHEKCVCTRRRKHPLLELVKGVDSGWTGVECANLEAKGN